MTELGPVELPPASGPVKGFVSTAPTALGLPMQVIVPSFSADHSYEIRRWSARGLTVPAVGDEVLLIEDENGIPWVVSWWPAGGDALLSGVRDYGIVTVLPTGTIIKGSLCKFKAAAGIYWDLTYTEEAEYPWAKLGGPPLRSEVATDESTTSTTNVNLATEGPKLTSPLKGEYDVAWGFDGYTSPAASAALEADLLIAGTTSGRFCEVTGYSAAIAGSTAMTEFTTVQSSASIAFLVKYRTTAGTAHFRQRWLRLDPRRVG